MAFIIVQHLDPSHDSMMVDLLAGHTSMPVLLATDGMKNERQHVYVIPAWRRSMKKGGCGFQSRWRGTAHDCLSTSY